MWENGKNTRIETYTPGGDLDVYFELTYNDEGNITKKAQYTADGSLEEYRSYTYEDGNLVEETVHRSNDSVMRKIMYAYDQYGNPTKIVFEGSGGTVQEIVTREYIERDIVKYINK
jgi:NADPH-dependent curcumin reductase CurA